MGDSARRPDSILCVCQLGNPREWRMVVRGNDKLVVDVLRCPTHLFDLESDPYEMHNLVRDSQYAAKRNGFEERLRDWILQVG